METPLLQPVFQRAHALRCCATHGPHAEDLKGDSTHVEKKARRKKLQQRLGDSPSCGVAANFTSFEHLWTKMCLVICCGMNHRVNQCSDLIDELLLVREMMQVAPGASQCSVIVLPFARALPIKKEQWTPCQEVRSFLKEDPHRPGQPLEIETEEQSGDGCSEYQELNPRKPSFVTQLLVDNSK